MSKKSIAKTNTPSTRGELREPRKPRRAPPDEAAAEWMRVGALRPWDDNPRDNDGEPVDRVAASIKRFGFGTPLLVRASTLQVIAGHTRLKAAQLLGMEWVPVRKLVISEHDAHLLAVADNRLSEFSKWSDAPLHELLAKYALDERELAGWSDYDFRKLTERIADVPEPPADFTEYSAEQRRTIVCPQCGFQILDTTTSVRREAGVSDPEHE